MITDGERIKSLLAGAKHRVLLCAPFVKAGVLQTILSVVPESIPVQVVTRWRAAEVAAGVSDLDTLLVADERPNTKLALLDDLHAKLYLADDQCLVGSANLTASALGWSERSNIELLVPALPNDPEVARLLEHLESAMPATVAMRLEIEVAVATLQSNGLDEAQDMVGDGKSRGLAWLPRCAAPHKLYEMYRNPETAVVVDSTKFDGFSDLRDLQIKRGLSPIDFEAAVQSTLILMPAFGRIIEEVPQGLPDARGVMRVKESRPDLERQDVERQWRIVRDWIRVFFADRFEVAPESFVTRMKPR